MASPSIIPLSTSTVALALVLVSGLLLYICVDCFINYRKLSQFKGPPLAAVSGLWLWKQSLSKRMHIAQAEALQKYGTERTLAFVVGNRTDTAFPQAPQHALDPTCL